MNHPWNKNDFMISFFKKYKNWINLEDWNKKTNDGVFEEKWMYL